MLTLLNIFLLLISCTVNQEKEIPLPGKIVVTQSDRTLVTYESGKIRSQIRLRNDDVTYDGLRLMHHSNDFVGVEYLKTESGRTNQGNVVRFDSVGKVIDRIYESKEGELAGDTYSSGDDQKLLITTEIVGNNKENPLEGLSRKQTVLIFDLEQRKVINEIHNIGSSPGLQIEESPWLPDGNQFVYSLSGERRIVSGGEVVNPLNENYAGVYIYDLTKGQSKLLVADGHFAIASPVRDEIAYMKGNTIRILDLKKNAEKIVFEFEPKEKVPDIHWTPDGKHIYLAYFHYHLGMSDLFTTGEKLVDANTGKEVAFTKVGHGFHTYTWK